MLSLHPHTRYFLYRKPCDMRYGIYSLAGLVQNELELNPVGGDVFVFLGKRSNQVRLLQWEGDGFAMYVKKLERGTYEWPPGEQVQLDSQRLALLLSGVSLKTVRFRQRYSRV